MEVQLDPWKASDDNDTKVVGILDMDAFECQIYLKIKHPEDWEDTFCTQPVALRLQNSSRIVSLNRRAKVRGLDRSMTWKEAVSLVPELVLLEKDQMFGKPETKNMRTYSQRIYEAILDFRTENQMKFLLEYASVDEFYLDLTSDVDAHIKKHGNSMGQLYFGDGDCTQFHGDEGIIPGKDLHFKMKQMDNDPSIKLIAERRLFIGACLINQIRRQVHLHMEGMTSSCGVASNKLLAKLGLSLGNRPHGTTILSDSGLSHFSKKIKLNSVPGLKGETGQRVVQRSKIYFQKEDIFMSDLQSLSYPELMNVLDCGQGIGRTIFRIVQGDCTDDVLEKSMAVSIPAGAHVLYGSDRRDRFFFSPAKKVLANMCDDLHDKLGDDFRANSRTVKKITATFRTYEGPHSFTSSEYRTLFAHDLFSHFEPLLRSVYDEFGANNFFEHVELRATF